MTKKDYIRIAQVFKAHVNRLNLMANTENKLAEVKSMTSSMSDMLQNDNPRFDRDRFIAACGIQRSN